MNPEDREKCRKFFSEAWDSHQSLDSFLGRAGLTHNDLARLWHSPTFQRLCRKMRGGMAARREIEVGRAAMEAATKLTEFVARREKDTTLNELARKTYGDTIKLARGHEDREIEERRDAKRNPEPPDDAGASPQLSKPQRIAILKRMLGTAEEADD